MENDIQRIEVGNTRFGAITDSIITPPENQFNFSSEKVTFDQVDQTFDEETTN